MKKVFIFSTIIFCFFFATADSIVISDKEALNIGKKIYKNECGNKIENLTFWNKAEEFPSLGIGHCTWCPEGKSCPFSEGFPPLLAYMKDKGIKLPAWLTPSTKCPWTSRQAFMRDFHGKKMTELRTFLQETVDIQAEFIVQRIIDSLPVMLESIPQKNRQHVQQQFFRMARSTNGLYALIDYANFKGIGTHKNDNYKGHGWGLLQILQKMQGKRTNSAVQEFVAIAKNLLKQRVKSSPPKRNEKQFIPGWYNRLDTYMT